MGQSRDACVSGPPKLLGGKSIYAAELKMAWLILYLPKSLVSVPWDDDRHYLYQLPQPISKDVARCPVRQATWTRGYLIARTKNGVAAKLPALSGAIGRSIRFVKNAVTSRLRSGLA